ncbi:J domain-containing protein [Chromohalobacter israelensis]|uniref:J domain-containing protein n=1 Tax=Chromohalobacter israelensis TaxID=141390 RepID=UPI000FFE7B50|nr:J domain-containing protein [Chromohalobacter salexigens]RXE47502.1 hypothetical protein B4O83_05685 [Chromohalobacter salexigens]
MASSRFTPFERLLLTSRNEADTAALLLLAWLAMSDGQETLSPRKRALLDELTGDFRHDHGHQLLVDLASGPDFVALQLAAEILQRYYRGPRRETFLRQAIHIATHDGGMAAGQHHVLRFLADLLGVMPETFGVLFRDVAGYPLETPEDLSKAQYWQLRDGARERDSERGSQPGGEEPRGEKAKREKAKREETKREDAEDAKRSWRKRHDRQREHDRGKREQAHGRERAHEHERERDGARHHRRWRRDGAGQHDKAYGDGHSRYGGHERKRHEGFSHDGMSGGRSSAHDEKTQRALAVLGLMGNVQKSEVKRAYRRLAQKYHPDRYHAQSQEAMATASLRFQRIKNAYDYLMRQHA